jgi:hypothetical protein
MAGFAQPVAHAGGTPVLPDDCGRERLPGLAIPQQRRLALIRDADAGEVLRRDPGVRQRLARAIELRAQDLLRIVLDPPRLRKMLREVCCATPRTCPSPSNTIARELVVP